MISRKIGLLFITGILLSSVSVFADNYSVKQYVLDADIYSSLISNGVVNKCRDDGITDYSLMPQNLYSDILKNSKVEKAGKNYPFVYESLYYLNKKEILSMSNSTAQDITIADISRVFRSVSKMEGMKYYSSTKKKECVLYEKVYMVSEENSDTRIEDQNTGSSDGQISYCMQDDHSFGVNHYKLSYHEGENQLLAQFYLTDVMGLGPFKAIYPGKMVINILAIDCGENIMLYLCTDLDSVKFPGIKNQINDSMTSRMDAIYKWFITQF